MAVRNPPTRIGRFKIVRVSDHYFPKGRTRTDLNLRFKTREAAKKHVQANLRRRVVLANGEFDRRFRVEQVR